MKHSPIRNVKQKKKRAGFSLSEMLVVLLIVSLATAVAAAGIPSAVRAYKGVTDSSNAQLLLSTAVTELRDELGTATGISVGDDSTGEPRIVTYRNSLGHETRLYVDIPDGSAASKGLMLQEYLDVSSASRPEASPLVSVEASGRTLTVVYESADYDSDTGLITFHGLAVLSPSGTAARLETLAIRTGGVD